MKTIKLTEEGDLDLSNFRSSFVTKIDFVAQKIRCKLNMMKGEWYLDRDAGIPYLTEILGKNKSDVRLQEIFVMALAEIPEITKIKSFDIENNYQLRTKKVTFSVITEEGEITEIIDLTI